MALGDGIAAIGAKDDDDGCLAGCSSCDSGAVYVLDLAVCLPAPQFRRGDGNGDGGVDIGDPIFNLAHLFSGGPGPCRDSQDTNDDGLVDIADPIYGLAFLFSSAPSPPAPFPACGSDPTPDGLDCFYSPACP